MQENNNNAIIALADQLISVATAVPTFCCQFAINSYKYRSYEYP